MPALPERRSRMSLQQPKATKVDPLPLTSMDAAVLRGIAENGIGHGDADFLRALADSIDAACEVAGE